MTTYRDFAIELALKAGEIMEKNFSLGMKKEWKEYDDSPLTVTDTTINSMVVNAVRETYPAHGVIGEEESFEMESDYQWVCDPVDGTAPFSHGMPIFTFSLALVEKGVPILGVVYDPNAKKLFVAEKGKGATCNGHPLHVSDSTSWKRTAMAVEVFGTAAYDLMPLSDVLQKEGARVFTLCSYVYGAMLVAQGEMSAALFTHTNPWDVAAAKIIVEEAGGVCTDVNGNDQRYDQKVKGMIATNGKIHKELIEKIKNL